MDTTLGTYEGPATVGGLSLPKLHIRIYEADAEPDMSARPQMAWEAEASFRAPDVDGFTMEWANSGDAVEVELPRGEKGRAYISEADVDLTNVWTISLTGSGPAPMH